MPSRKDCIDDILQRTGGRKSRREVEDALDDIFEAAKSYEQDGLSPDEAYAKARDERLEREGERAALARRQERENAFKAIELQRWTDRVAKEDKLPRHLAGEAMLTGVNPAAYGSQNSIAARRLTLRDKWLGDAGLDGALERAGLFKEFATGVHDRDVGRELYEYDKGPYGSPGITKNEKARQIAEILHTVDKQALADHNQAGGFIRSLFGHMAKTTHDPDAIRYAAAGGRNRPLLSFDLNPWAVGGTDADAAQWIADIERHFDMRKSFGNMPPKERQDILRQMWGAFARGDHFDYSVAVGNEPIHPNVAAKAAAHRELIPKSADDWLAYNDKYGLYRNIREAKLAAYEHLANQTALIARLGTKPSETFEEWIKFQKGAIKDPEERRRFDKHEHVLRNEFAWLDGSANRPINKIAARIIRNWMAWERMSMLGRVPFTHIAGLPTKSAELRYWGAGMADRFGSVLRGVMDTDAEMKRALWTSADATRSYIQSKYDAADAPSGIVHRMENLFMRLTMVPRLLDNERVNTEQVFAHLVGSKRGLAWAAIDRDKQRVLRAFGIEEPEWKALNKVEWTRGRGMDGDAAYLTPSDALKLSDDDIRAYLEERPLAGQRAIAPDEAAIARARNDLAERLASAYGERARYAMFVPGVRAKARLFGQLQQTNPWLYRFVQLTAQFRLWPMEMFYRTWGREIFGRKGDPVMGRMAAALELAVASMVFGIVSNAMREATQGQDPITHMRAHPLQVVLDGFLRSGAGTIFGDYLFGEFDRHGRQASAQIMGPTFGKIDQIMDLIHGGGPNERSPWRRRGADLADIVRENTPMVNLWFTAALWQYLVVYRFQEWMHPGYLARMERKLKDERGIEFMVSPRAAVR